MLNDRRGNVITWIMIVIVAVAAGVGARFIIQNVRGLPPQQGVPIATSSSPVISSSLLDIKEPQRCEVFAPSGQSKAIYYLTKEWVRIEGTVTSPILAAGEPLKTTHALLDLSRGIVYGWQDGIPFGTLRELSSEPLNAMKQSISQTVSQAKCAPWSPDLSSFALPSKVMFSPQPVAKTNGKPAVSKPSIPSGPELCWLTYRGSSGTVTQTLYYMNDDEGRVRQETRSGGKTDMVIQNTDKRETYLWREGEAAGTFDAGPKSNLLLLKSSSALRSDHEWKVGRGFERELTCQAWSPDSSLFFPPSGVNFQNFVLE